jgi:hypothetical protein
MIVTKSRCNALNQAVISKPGEDVATTIRNWLEGEPAQQQAPRTVDQDTGEITEPGHETRQQARERIQRQAPAVAGACEVQAGPSEAHPAASSIIGHCANCGRALADNVVRSYRQHGVADNQMLCSKCRKEQAAAKPQEQAAQPAQAVEQPALPSENNPDGDADLASRFGDEDPFAG